LANYFFLSCDLLQSFSFLKTISAFIVNFILQTTKTFVNCTQKKTP